MILVNIWFDTPQGNYNYLGMVTTRIISPSKLFRKAFGFNMPEHTEVTLI